MLFHLLLLGKVIVESVLVLCPEITFIHRQDFVDPDADYIGKLLWILMLITFLLLQSTATLVQTISICLVAAVIQYSPWLVDKDVHSATFLCLI